MPDGSLACTLGALQAHMDNMKDTLQAHMENMKTTLQEMKDGAEADRVEMRKVLREMDTRVRRMEDTILTARVSWRTIIWVGSTVAAIASFIAAMVKIFYEPIMKLAKAILPV